MLNRMFFAQNVSQNIHNGLGYGLLYNWDIMNPNYTNVWNIAPTGWRVPTTTDWNTLISYCGGASVAGGRLKEIGYKHWNYPNSGTDQYGFTGVGNGIRGIQDDENYVSLNVFGWFWSSIESGLRAYAYTQIYNISDFTNGTIDKKCGCAIRLIKNDNIDPGIFRDYDGNVYDTVKIGNQVWMKQNMKTTHSAYGMAIKRVDDYATWKSATYPAYCYFNNDENNV